MQVLGGGLWQQENIAPLHAGAGGAVVWQSEEDSEFSEMQLKARAVVEAIEDSLT